MTRRPKALSGLLRRYDPPVRALALKLRDLVLREMGPCHECLYDAGYTVAFWYSYTGRITDGVCLIAVYTKHVNLGFTRGTTLPDPHRLLEGTGTWMRHIKMRTPADLVRPEIPEYVRAAIAEADDDPRDSQRAPMPRVVTIVKRASRKRGTRR